MGRDLSIWDPAVATVGHLTRHAPTMPSEPPLPSFLIIGAQRGATRWLRSNLSQHPQIFMPPFDLGFFDDGRAVPQARPQVVRARSSRPGTTSRWWASRRRPTWPERPSPSRWRRAST